REVPGGRCLGLPVQAGRPRAAAHRPSRLAVPLTSDSWRAMSPSDKVNILVVDDLPEKLLTFRTILEELGENLVLPNSGEEALRRLLEQDFAVILLDVNMPRLNGFETARLIRGRKKSALTPIIFITAFSDEVHTAQGYSLGAVDYILAPVVPDILRTKVKV